MVSQYSCFKLCATTRNNMQQGLQMDATCNIQQSWELLANDVASVCTGLYRRQTNYLIIFLDTTAVTREKKYYLIDKLIIITISKQ